MADLGGSNRKIFFDLGNTCAGCIYYERCLCNRPEVYRNTSLKIKTSILLMVVRKKRVDVSAFQFTGTNYEDFKRFIGGRFDSNNPLPNFINKDGVCVELNIKDIVIKEDLGLIRLTPQQFISNYDFVQPSEIETAHDYIRTCNSDVGFLGSKEYDEAKEAIRKYQESIKILT